jgi:hypothetical protein
MCFEDVFMASTSNQLRTEQQINCPGVILEQHCDA